MSLNRCEQRVFDYLQGHADEKRFWQEKVRAAARAKAELSQVAARLEVDLWHYYEERSAVASPFREAVRTEGLRRTSLRNLAELLLRLWTDPPPAPRGVGPRPPAP